MVLPRCYNLFDLIIQTSPNGLTFNIIKHRVLKLRGYCLLRRFICFSREIYGDYFPGLLSVST